jgi:protein-tyrosine phosphatase
MARHNARMQTPSRLLPLQGASNFRDLGGYAGHGGRTVRWRRLFRSDHLGGLTPTDHDAVQSLGIRRAFDFRGAQESQSQPYRVPGLVQHPLPIEPTVAQQMHALAQAGLPLTPQRMEGLMEDLYLRLVDHESARFAQWFGHLLADDSPQVFHCTAGKDRTGLAAALLLRALGVPQAVVEADYLLTNVHYRRPPSRDPRVPDDALAVLWSVRPAFLHAAFDRIDRQHGGLQRFLQQRLQLTPADRDRLAALYLEPA